MLSGMPPWFDKKLMLASGLGYSGSSVGFFFGPPLILVFSEMYGIRGMFIMLAGIWIHTLLVGIIQRPCPTSNKVIWDTSHAAKEIKVSSLGANGTTERTDMTELPPKCNKTNYITVDSCDINSHSLENMSGEQGNSNIKESFRSQKFPTGNASYLNLLKKPRVLHAYVILFLGIFGSLGKKRIVSPISWCLLH